MWFILLRLWKVESEDSSSVSQKLLAFIKANLLVSGLFFLGIILLSFGLIQLFSRPSEEIEFITEKVEGAQISEIYVDVSGEVQKPGVYKLEGNSRTQDAIIAAGGFTADADRQYVSKGMNLAAPLTDGMKIYIPKKGEAAPVASNKSLTAGSSGGLMSINSASQSELESLPGIGPVTADKIISGRPYGSVDELKSKKVVGSATFEKIKDLVGL